ncbi:nucleoside-diphosphate-sugar epimerase [Flavobacterium sp. 90]|uniref:SDR family oxidoreductase n=1 Tax=unclassified Flavobacterium TaxID=196869 RepID=UPI000EAEEEB4|nr:MULTISPECIES: SDR family oxidoreductase [unclassified Flavobacterium]RKR05761.1 nucleoside-diphosphate-sugar epimerase [Flavobacterium sp. 81]TCK57071.1 nucleoside-diphosphate-sugar epimerase [Flavobacterium sp. 90]
MNFQKSTQEKKDTIALVVGATGIAGSNLALKLLENGWTVYGLSRNPKNDIEGLRPIAADLLNTESLATALANVAPTHVFFTTWMRNDTEEENIRVNSAMVRNLLNVLSPKKSVKHVSLVTGLKHYLGPFDAYATAGTLPETPLREEQPRLNLPNFYYAQEDEVYAAAARDGFAWNVHRPHTLIGKTIGNAMNMGTTLAVYASICKYEGTPFIWPGSDILWNGLSDVTDAKVLADQIIWAATSTEVQNQGFNVINGDFFRWKWLWPKIAEWFDIEFEGYNGSIRPLEAALENKNAIWKEISKEHQLIEEDLGQLASAWHTDLDLGLPLEVITDMSKSRKLGFTTYKESKDSFFELFAQLRNDKIIP